MIEVLNFRLWRDQVRRRRFLAWRFDYMDVYELARFAYLYGAHIGVLDF
jgi:hypothetical protein